MQLKTQEFAQVVQQAKQASESGTSQTSRRCRHPDNLLLLEFLECWKKYIVTHNVPDEHTPGRLHKLVQQIRDLTYRIYSEKQLKDLHQCGNHTCRIVQQHLWSQYPPSPPTHEEQQLELVRCQSTKGSKAKPKAKAMSKGGGNSGTDNLIQGSQSTQLSHGGPSSLGLASPSVNMVERPQGMDPLSFLSAALARSNMVNEEGVEDFAALVAAHCQHPADLSSQNQSMAAVTGVCVPTMAAVGSCAAGRGRSKTKKATATGVPVVTGAARAGGKATKEYVPGAGTANYAFMITLYLAHKAGTLHMEKDELMRAAEVSGLSTTSIYGTGASWTSQGAEKYYSGWSSFTKTLKNKVTASGQPLVQVLSKPMRVSLTQEGMQLAARLYKEAVASSKLAPVAGIDPDLDIVTGSSLASPGRSQVASPPLMVGTRGPAAGPRGRCQEVSRFLDGDGYIGVGNLTQESDKQACNGRMSCVQLPVSIHPHPPMVETLVGCLRKHPELQVESATGLATFHRTQIHEDPLKVQVSGRLGSQSSGAALGSLVARGVSSLEEGVQGSGKRSRLRSTPGGSPWAAAALEEPTMIDLYSPTCLVATKRRAHEGQSHRQVSVQDPGGAVSCASDPPSSFFTQLYHSESNPRSSCQDLNQAMISNKAESVFDKEGNLANEIPPAGQSAHPNPSALRSPKRPASEHIVTSSPSKRIAGNEDVELPPLSCRVNMVMEALQNGTEGYVDDVMVLMPDLFSSWYRRCVAPPAGDSNTLKVVQGPSKCMPSKDRTQRVDSQPASQAPLASNSQGPSMQTQRASEVVSILSDTSSSASEPEIDECEAAASWDLPWPTARHPRRLKNSPPRGRKHEQIILDSASRHGNDVCTSLDPDQGMYPVAETMTQGGTKVAETDDMTEKCQYPDQVGRMPTLKGVLESARTELPTTARVPGASQQSGDDGASLRYTGPLASQVSEGENASCSQMQGTTVRDRAPWPLPLVSQIALEDCCEIGLPPLPPGRTFNDIYQVVMYVDAREQFSRNQGGRKLDNTAARNLMMERLRGKGVLAEQQQMEKGDALWVARPRIAGSGPDYVLDFILERKGVDDLLGSIAGGNRYVEQKFFLSRSGVRYPLYLVEGDPDRLAASEPQRKAVKTATLETALHDGFTVIETRGTEGTVEAYVALTRAIERLYGGRRGGQTHRCCKTFRDFAAGLKQTIRESRTVKVLWGLMLTCVPGIGPEAAEAISAVYPRPRDLYQAYSRAIAEARVHNRDAQQAALALLAQLPMPRTKVTLGQNKSKNVYEHLFAHGWGQQGGLL